MDLNTTRHGEDELDLFGLFQIIWDGKWVIVLCTAVALASTGMFLFVSKPVYEAKLLIQGPSFETMSELEQINRFSDIKIPIISDGRIIGYEDATTTDITAEKIFEVFIDEFNDYNELQEAVKKYSLKYAKFEGSGTERTEFLYEIARNFHLIKISDGPDTYQLKFQFSNPAEAKKIVEFALSNVSDNANLSLIKYLKNISKAYKQNSFDKISWYEDKISSRNKILQINHKQKINFLTEQTTIARELDLKENIQNIGGAVIYVEAPYYIRGYKAIDKEIEQLQNKSIINIYLADNLYLDLIEKLENEKTNMPHVRFNLAIDKLPLNKTDNLFRYDPMLVQFTMSTNRMIILILYLIFVSITGIMIVLFRHVYKQHQTNLVA